MSSYEEWLEWRRRYYLNNESSGHNDSLSNWENEGGSKVVDQMVKDFLEAQATKKNNLHSLPEKGCEGGHY